MDGIVGIGLCALARFDPETEKILDEHPEGPAGVIDLVGLFVAGRDESFAEPYGSARLGLEQTLDLILDFLEVIDEVPGSAIGDEAAGLQCGFQGALDRVWLFL
jgi:hypothetical protein